MDPAHLIMLLHQHQNQLLQVQQVLNARRRVRRRRRRAIWVRQWIIRRPQLGLYDRLMVELRNEDPRAASRAQTGPSSDAIIVWMNGTSPVVSDRHIRQYGEPTVDATNNVQIVSGSRTNGATTVTFTRPLVTGDTAEDYSDDCAFFLFSWGGTVQTNGQLTQHTFQATSEKEICFTTCKPTDPVTLKRRVPFFFTITGINFDPAYLDKNTPTYKSLERDVLTLLKSEMSGIRGYIGVSVDRFSRGSVVVHSAVDLEQSGQTEADIQTSMRTDVATQLEKMVTKVQTGGFRLDTTSESFNALNPEPINQAPVDGGADEDDLGTTERIIIGVVVAGFGLLVILALGTCYRKKLSGKKDVSKNPIIDINYPPPTDTFYPRQDMNGYNGMTVAGPPPNYNAAPQYLYEPPVQSRRTYAESEVSASSSAYHVKFSPGNGSKTYHVQSLNSGYY